MIISNSLFIPKRPREKRMGVGRKQERYNGREHDSRQYYPSSEKGPIAIEGARIVGFALLLAWFSASGFLVSSATANSADFLTLVAFTALLFIAAFVGRSRDIRRQATILCPVFSAVAAVGTIVPSFTADSPIISIICSLLTAPVLLFLFSVGVLSLASEVCLRSFWKPLQHNSSCQPFI